MSDDLISRKAFMEYLGLEDTEENREENVGEIVTLEDFDRQATAFDNEKVIDIIAHANSAIVIGDKYKALHWMKKLEEIVEKGGIE